MRSLGKERKLTMKKEKSDCMQGIIIVSYLTADSPMTFGQGQYNK